MIALERPIGGGFAVRNLLVASSLVITLAGTGQSSFAQSSNPEESAARATMQSQTPGGTWAVIEAQVKNTLEQAGFKNIRVMPSSFVVQAEKNGKPLTLVINSDGKTVSYQRQQARSKCPSNRLSNRRLRVVRRIEGVVQNRWLRNPYTKARQ